ncbi:BgtA-21156 [Blumeria graminis f. sp. tritici]|uniref:BgtA-21156 n=2 Tax=Blumeria graminis f. sp. tritici TaxID=62690 RepID=A0A9X9MLB8_BLUGR|nr:hypothetical protein BGT96224_A21156 [Blumeria graminis f. sp. tritici 96224]VDB92463.1 BgtA-21156 [Blumeria graminis f. sp. tritici]
MDDFESAFVVHNTPLLIISGISSGDKGDLNPDRVNSPVSDALHVDPEVVSALTKCLRNVDATELAWNSQEFAGKNKFRFKIVGEEYTLPNLTTTRKGSTKVLNQKYNQNIHSILSPLCPDSELFPDGLINSKWIEKHQDSVPSVLVRFYAFSNDPNLSTVHDNQLKTDIINLKKNISQSGYRTRFVVIIFCNKKSSSIDIENRLSKIRRDTGFDTKTSLFYFYLLNSSADLEGFLDTIISSIYSVCIDYYLELSKHARRKKNRSAVPRQTAPSTSGTSQTLSIQGWNFRYDFKLGIFAEFRQEMESAQRQYEGAYEALLGPDVIETIASLSTRCKEARCLADIISLRIIRCQLWNGNHCAAVRRWAMHKERMKDYVDRRGKGSNTYGWEAWEARWSKSMAEMIKKVSIPELESSLIYFPVEKNIALSEIMPPWFRLHHPGYWFLAASKHIMARRQLAQQIPEEDRIKPGSSVSKATRKGYMYDTYMCPEPYEEYPPSKIHGTNHSSLILDLLDKAIYEFETRKQSRFIQELKLLYAKELMLSYAWKDALNILKPLGQTMSYRKECWWNAAGEVLRATRKAAMQVGDAQCIVAVDWELMNNDFSSNSEKSIDLTCSLEGLNLEKKPIIVLKSDEVHSFLTMSYTFNCLESNVGELCSSQLSISSNSIISMAPLTIADIKVNFEGSLKSINIKHKETLETSSSSKLTISTHVLLREILEDGCLTLIGDTDLRLLSGQTRVLEFKNYFRESGEVKAVSATASMFMNLFDLTYVHNLANNNSMSIRREEETISRRLMQHNCSSVKVLPKPPKLKLELGEKLSQYFINEQISLPLKLFNDEVTDSFVYLDAQLLGESLPEMSIKIDFDPHNFPEKEEGDENLDFPGIRIGKVLKGEVAVVNIIIPALQIPAKYEISIKAAYYLTSDKKEPVYKTLVTEFQVICPFEAEFNFTPEIYPDPWPSLFSHNEDELSIENKDKNFKGLAQKWSLSANFKSSASTTMIIEDINLEIFPTNEDVNCLINLAIKIPKEGLQILPDSQEEAHFDISVQKLSLEDRRAATLEMFFILLWRRDNQSSLINRTVLSVPQCHVLSSEPRVLAAVSSSSVSPIICLDLVIENPSSHFLSFGMNIEPCEKVAFSGNKQRTLQLLPLSRKKVQFRLLPSMRSEWIGPIRCTIRDRYFQKVLKVSPNRKLRSDKDGIMIRVPTERL